jgi:hypothetical protein
MIEAVIAEEITEIVNQEGISYLLNQKSSPDRVVRAFFLTI